MFGKKPKKTVYTGEIIVCLDKARRFSALEHGKKILEDLNGLKIIKHQGKLLKNQSENSEAVPVSIHSLNDQTYNFPINCDWTSISPISEISGSPLPRWWPKDMFQCSQRLGETEEVTIEGYNFIIKLIVKYTFFSKADGIFDDIPTKINMDEAAATMGKDIITALSSVEENSPLLLDFKKGDTLDDQFEITKENKVETKKKSNLKIIVGSTLVVLISIGVYLGIKLFSHKD